MILIFYITLTNQFNIKFNPRFNFIMYLHVKYSLIVQYNSVGATLRPAQINVVLQNY